MENTKRKKRTDPQEQLKKMRMRQITITEILHPDYKKHEYQKEVKKDAEEQG